MKATSALLLLAASLAAAAGRVQAIELAPGQVLIELRSNVLSHGPVALLGDVARIRTGDLEAIRRLVQLPIGRSPRPGVEAVARQQDLARWVRRQTSLPHERLVWAGADQVRVRTATGPVAGDAVEVATSGSVPFATPVIATSAAAAMVSRGDWVIVRYRSGSVELEGRAQALQEGRLGQVVQVRTASAAAAVAARVVGPAQVEALQ